MRFLVLYKFASGPLRVYGGLLDPLDEFRTLHLNSFVCRFYFTLLSILQLPLLFLDGDETLLELITTEDDGKGSLFSFTSSELCIEFRFILGQKIRL